MSRFVNEVQLVEEFDATSLGIAQNQGKSEEQRKYNRALARKIFEILSEPETVDLDRAWELSAKPEIANVN